MFTGTAAGVLRPCTRKLVAVELLEPLEALLARLPVNVIRTEPRGGETEIRPGVEIVEPVLDDGPVARRVMGAVRGQRMLGRRTTVAITAAATALAGREQREDE